MLGFLRRAGIGGIPTDRPLRNSQTFVYPLPLLYSALVLILNVLRMLNIRAFGSTRIGIVRAGSSSMRCRPTASACCLIVTPFGTRRAVTQDSLCLFVLAQYSTGLSSSNRSVLSLVRSPGCLFSPTSLAGLEVQEQLVRRQEEVFPSANGGESPKVEFERSPPLQVDS